MAETFQQYPGEVLCVDDPAGGRQDRRGHRGQRLPRRPRCRTGLVPGRDGHPADAQGCALQGGDVTLPPVLRAASQPPAVSGGTYELEPGIGAEDCLQPGAQLAMRVAFAWSRRKFSTVASR